MTGIIYCAENNVNDKVYIGQTVKILEQRKKVHVKSRYNGYFQRALKKYNDWNWYMVQEYDCDKDKMKSVLNKAEMFYIDIYDSFKNGYNMTVGGDGVLGLKRSDKTKQKISAAKKGKRFSKEHKANISICLKGSARRKGTKTTEAARANMSAGQMGRKISDETKSKMSLSQIGNTNALGYEHTEEAKRKIRAARLGKDTWNKGKTGIYSEETKAKMSVAAKIRWAKQREAPCRI